MNYQADPRYGPQGQPTAHNPLWGMTTAHGSCLGFFQEYQKCYVQADIPEQECEQRREDYIECKTHLKEKARLKRIHEESLKTSH